MEGQNMLPTWETLVTWDSTPARPDTDGARQAGKECGELGGICLRGLSEALCVWIMMC